MKGILIDTAKREMREVTYNDNIGEPGSLQDHVGGWVECAGRFANGDVLFVDEEGFLKRKGGFFAFSGGNQPLAGNGILVGAEQYDHNGDYLRTDPPRTTIEELRAMVRFLDHADMRAWVAEHVNDPHTAINGEVVMTWGEFGGQIPGLDPSEESRDDDRGAV